MSNEGSECRSALFPCRKCKNKWFYNVDARNRHFKSSKECKKYQEEYDRAQSITASRVEIAPPSKSINDESFIKSLSSFHGGFGKNLSEELRSFRPQRLAANHLVNNGKGSEMTKNANQKDDQNLNSPHHPSPSINSDDDQNDIQVTLIRNFDDEDEDFEEDILFELEKAESKEYIDEEKDIEIVEHTTFFSRNYESLQNNPSLSAKSFPNDPIHSRREMSMDKTEAGTTFTHPSQVIDLTDDHHFINLAEEMTERKKLCLNADSRYVDSLKCLHLMMSMNLPFSAYDKLMNFKYGNNQKNVDYLSFLEVQKIALSKVYGESLGQRLKPRTTPLKLPSGRNVDVVTYDIDAMVFDLLADKKLTCARNLIFQDGDDTDPFKLTAKNYYDDFDTSEYYRKTAQKIRAVNSSHLEVPVILYMDETNLDAYSKLTLHPVTMSFMIYNRKTRNLERAWRTLGYMPNLQALAGSKSLSPEAKLCDYHFVLKFILSGLQELQRTGYYWKFQFPEYPGKEYERVLQFPLGLVIGDGKGSDTVCGKYQSRSKVKHICRDCNVLFTDSDKPDAKCSFYKMKDILSKSKDELNGLCFHKVEPYHAFDGLDFGENPYGINGCTPPDNCHQINKGIIERLPEIFFARLNKKMVEDMDVHSAFIATHMSSQSDRSVPSIRFFRNGLSEVAKLTSNENIGRIFAMYLTVLTRDFEEKVVSKKGRKFNKDVAATPITQDEYNKWIAVFEETLILYSWAYLERHPKTVFKGGKKSAVAKRMELFMEIFTKTANRRKGTGLKLMKFHQLKHLWIVCKMFAALPNVDSARNESHHRKKKKLAEKTQCRFNVLDEQTASNEFYFNLFLKAMKKANIKIADKFEMNFEKNHNEEASINEDLDNSEQLNSTILECKKKKGSTYQLTFDYANKKLVGKWIGKKIKKKEFRYPQHILDSVYSKLQGYNEGKPNQRISSVNCFTEFRCADNPSIVYRCCPDYMKSKDWFDWAYMKWTGYDQPLEAQLLMFIDLTTITFKECDPAPECDKFTSDTIVLSHSVNHNTISKSRPPALTGRGQGPITRIAQFATMEGYYHYADVSSIVRPAYVISDKIGDSTLLQPGRSTHVISISPLEQWHNHFLDYSSVDLIDEAAGNIDSDIDYDDEVYDYEG